MVFFKRNPKVYDTGIVMLTGSFAPNGSSAVSAASNKGKGFTVARASQGVFTITLDQAYAEFQSGQATLQHTTAADLEAQLGDYDATAKTLSVRVHTAGTATDVTANANSRVHFVLVLQKSAN